MYIKDKFSCNNNYVTAISAGIDCQGYVMRGAEYADIPINNRPYSYYYGNTWTDKLPEYYPDGNWKNIKDDGRKFVSITHYPRASCMNIATNSNEVYLPAVYPGSIVYLESSTGFTHTAIVRNVEIIGNTRTLSPANIFLIESTWEDSLTPSWAKVIKIQPNGIRRNMSLYAPPNWKWEINKLDQN